MIVEGVCVLEGKVSGTINFIQEESVCHVKGTVKGLTPGEHGFHVHQYGDRTAGCTSAGAHFNPYEAEHGSPTGTKEQRHVGDLGNITANSDGVATVDIHDSLVTLTGENSVLGRAIVVHADRDDLGLEGHQDSKTTGHAGARVACGVIGIAKP